MINFKLSDPGSPLAQDPVMAEYLRSYDFPIPPGVRYGFARIPTRQKKLRVGVLAQAWLPAHAVGTVALVHGYSEHSGNYARLIRDFVKQQLAVIAFDHRGHGLSEGPSGHVQFPNLYVEDAETVIQTLFPLVLPSRPLFLWGHSLGGLITLQLLMRDNLPVRPSAVALSSPMLGFPELKGPQALLAKLSPWIAKILPNLPVSHGIPSEWLSHDEVYLARRHDDPLIKKTTTPLWFESMKKAVTRVNAHAKDFANAPPTLLMLAGAEKITNLAAARRFAYQAYSSQKHKVIEFPGLYHELEKETAVRERVVGESIAWFRSHL